MLMAILRRLPQKLIVYSCIERRISMTQRTMIQNSTTQDFSFETYKSMFETYANRYDRSDGRVELKIIHTFSVVKIMEMLCSKRRLSKRISHLAMLCALFHDIGRFEQLKQYDTFLDHLSCDHAALSCRVLSDTGMLKALAPEDQKKILTAIENHNRYTIDPGLVNDTESFELCKLIRDADKCDIFRVFATDDMNDVVGASESEIAVEMISPAVRESILKHRCVDKLIRKTHLDMWISFLGFFFDLNYPESVEIAKNQGYYRMPFDRTEFAEPETRKQITEILTEVESYLSDRLSSSGNSRQISRVEIISAGDSVTIPSSLREFFNSHPNLALAFSGGCDSAYLLYAAVTCGCNVRAYYVSTPFQPQFELDDAERLVRELHAQMTVLPIDILTLPEVKRNPADRCYYCKNGIFHLILDAASQDGFREIIDGTNASDDAGDRPGMRALRELRVLSPLQECGITKKALREYSRNAGLFTWNKPAYACLATRIPANVPIEKEVLKKVEAAEQHLTDMGFSDFRVRILQSAGQPDSCSAKLQLTETDFPLLYEKRQELLEYLGGGFENILLDLNSRAPSVE